MVEADAQWMTRRADLKPLLALLIMQFVALTYRWVFDNWLSGFDTLSFFLPNWEYMGSRLRDLELPLWNPYVSSGAPMINDGGGGWMNLPVMLSFVLVPNPMTAYKVVMVIQTLIAGLATYAFTRRIGLGPLPALLAAASFSIGAPLYGFTYLSVVGSSLQIMVPVVLLGFECALRAHRLSYRLAWASLAGVGMVSFVASWPGQGTVYGCIFVGGWLTWRLLVEPVRPFGRRFIDTLITGGWASAIFLLIGAAAILPLLEFVGDSNVPNGNYQDLPAGDYAEEAFSLVTVLNGLVSDNFLDREMGAPVAVVALAVAAIFHRKFAFGFWFWASSLVIMIDLSIQHSLLRPILALVIPPFEHMHAHRPSGILWVIWFPLSMLGGIGLHWAIRDGFSKQTRQTTVALMIGALLWFEIAGEFVGIRTWVIVLAASALLMRSYLPWPRLVFPLRNIGIVWLALMLLFPTLSDISRTLDIPVPGRPRSNGPYETMMGTDDNTQSKIEASLGLDHLGEPLQYLYAMQEEEAQPFRIVTYVGSTFGEEYTPPPYLRLDWVSINSMIGSRPMATRIEPVAGYNPLHLKYYYEYMEAVSGGIVNYHWPDPTGESIGTSQLLDMLNATYVVVSKRVPRDREDIAHVYETLDVVYFDAQVVIFKNLNAFERGWLVHDVQQDSGTDALTAFSTDAVDGHETAFVFGEPPQLEPTTGTETESVTVTEKTEETISFSVHADGNALLVASEMYSPNWNAYLDGERVDTFRTNHALTGVYVPDGWHTVTLKYEPRIVYLGLIGTAAGSIAAAASGIWAWTDRRRHLRPEVDPA